MNSKKKKNTCKIVLSEYIPRDIDYDNYILILEGRVYEDDSFIINIKKINQVNLDDNILNDILNDDNEVVLDDDLLDTSYNKFYDKISVENIVGFVASKEIVENLKKTNFFSSRLELKHLFLVGIAVEKKDDIKIKWEILNPKVESKIKILEIVEKNLRECRIVLFNPIPEIDEDNNIIRTLEGRFYDEQPIIINIKQVHEVKINEKIWKNPLNLFYDEIKLKNFVGFLGSEEIIDRLKKDKFFSPILKLNKFILVGTRVFQGINGIKWEVFSLNKKDEIIIIEIVNLENKKKFYDRIEKLIDVNRLLSLKIGIIGLGTGGAFTAIQLAKTGVGTLELFDFDHLELENVIRHVCTLEDIGRLKINAISELLKKINPFLKVKCHPIDITKEIEYFRKEIKDFDLIMECTGTPSVSSTVNEIALQEKIPVIYGFVYPNAQGGFLMRVLPEEVFGNNAPCLQCILPKIIEGIEKPVLTEEQRLRYTEVSDVSELIAEPGLSVDITFISNFQTKLMLMTLPKLPKVAQSFKDKFNWKINSYNFFFWFNEPYAKNLKIFTLIPAKIKQDNYCSHCNKEKWYEREIKNISKFIKF